jgi:hypothetical protein
MHTRGAYIEGKSKTRLNLTLFGEYKMEQPLLKVKVTFHPLFSF